jgi:hypothetical protein
MFLFLWVPELASASATSFSFLITATLNCVNQIQSCSTTDRQRQRKENGRWLDVNIDIYLRS